MKGAYEEIIDRLPMLRLPVSPRHEQICCRLHEGVAAALGPCGAARLLPLRSRVALSSGTVLRPDLAVVMRANGRLWLAAEVIEPGDHHADTVAKKLVYEELRVPRLWMVDPRYDNLEVYHATTHGLMLKGILTGRELLAEPAMGNWSVRVADLFG
jgi:hypothetical protein